MLRLLKICVNDSAKFTIYWLYYLNAR